jgi:hypothetical protein
MSVVCKLPFLWIRLLLMLLLVDYYDLCKYLELALLPQVV